MVLQVSQKLTGYYLNNSKVLNVGIVWQSKRHPNPNPNPELGHPAGRQDPSPESSGG